MLRHLICNQLTSVKSLPLCFRLALTTSTFTYISVDDTYKKKIICLQTKTVYAQSITYHD